METGDNVYNTGLSRLFASTITENGRSLRRQADGDLRWEAVMLASRHGAVEFLRRTTKNLVTATEVSDAKSACLLFFG